MKYSALLFVALLHMGLFEPPFSLAASAGEVLRRYAGLNKDVREKSLFEGARREGRVVFWGVLTAPDFQAVSTAFKKRYSGVDVEYFRSGPERNVTRLFSEAKAGRYDVDLFQNTSVGTWAVMQKGLVDAYMSSEAGFLKKGLYDVTASWYALHHLFVALAFNTNLVSKNDAPRNYQELLDSKWKGKLSMDTEDYDVLTALEIAWGEQKATAYLKALAQQDIKLVRGRTQQAQLLAAGEFPVSIGLYLHRIAVLKSQGAPVDYLLFDPLVSKPIPVTLMKNAPHPHAAALFLDWALSREGQEVITQKTGHFIARKDVPDRFGGIVKDDFVSIGPEVEGKGTEERIKRFRQILPSL